MVSPESSALDALLDRGFRYALALTHDATRAEDLLHDAVVSILRRKQLDNVGYLLTTIRNRFIDLYRRERLVVMLPLDESNEEVLETIDAPDMTLDPEKLEKALAALRPAEREAIYLFSVEDYTAQEIADATGRPRGTVLSLMHRARRKLRAWMAPKNVEAQQ